MIVAPERLTPGSSTGTGPVRRRRGPERHFGDADDCAWLDQPLDHQDRDAAEDQRHSDDLRIAEQRLDLVDQQEAEDRRGQEADEDVADEPPRHRLASNRPSSTAQKVRQ